MGNSREYKEVLNRVDTSSHSAYTPKVIVDKGASSAHDITK